MWTLGLLSCVILAFLNQFFSYRSEPLSITAVSAQIAALPLGRLMAAYLPTTYYRVPFTNWKWTMNPGPFNVKEHVLITIFANSGAGGAYAINIVTIVKAFYKKRITFFVGLLITITTQVRLIIAMCIVELPCSMSLVFSWWYDHVIGKSKFYLELMSTNPYWIFGCGRSIIDRTNLNHVYTDSNLFESWLCRWSDTGGRAYFESIWWNLLKCGGLQIWSKYLYLGKPFGSTLNNIKYFCTLEQLLYSTLEIGDPCLRDFRSRWTVHLCQFQQRDWCTLNMQK